MAIKCCKDCVPPTRYPGCHAKCEQYKAEKAKWEEEKKIMRKKRNEEQNYVIHPSDFEMLACMHRPRKDKRRR